MRQERGIREMTTRSTRTPKKKQVNKAGECGVDLSEGGEQLTVIATEILDKVATNQ